MTTNEVAVITDAADLETIFERIELYFGPQSMGRVLKYDVTEMLAARTEARFESEGDLASGEWTPLAEATLRIREAHGQVPIVINHRTGEMEQWATTPFGRVYSVSDGYELEYPGSTPTGDLEEKVMYAQGIEGDNARPILAVNEVDLEGTLDILYAQFEKLVIL